jgi:hypothetical protein
MPLDGEKEAEKLFILGDINNTHVRMSLLCVSQDFNERRNDEPRDDAR